jgi:aspartate aminotransferase-like enzyme
VPERIRHALAEPPPHHRTDAFRATLRGVTEALATLHGTQGEVFTLAASGTGAMEAAVINLMAPGARALAVVGGVFGQRWADLLRAHEVPHEVMPHAWGTAPDPAELAARLDADPDLAVVFATHSETSTGTLADVRALARETRARGRVLVVDAVTSLAVHPLEQDAWGLDVVVCGSQKGLMLPPGLATLSLAPWARRAIEGQRRPRFYFDLTRARRGLATGDTPFTPPVSHVLALEVALAMLREEGLAAVHDRHRRLAHAVRAGGLAAGCRLFSSAPSHAVTALEPPAGVEAAAIVRRLREAHGMVVAGGQGELRGRILRVGHMGAHGHDDAVAVSAALAECTAALGAPVAADAAQAAREAWGAA